MHVLKGPIFLVILKFGPLIFRYSWDPSYLLPDDKMRVCHGQFSSNTKVTRYEHVLATFKPCWLNLALKSNFAACQNHQKFKLFSKISLIKETNIRFIFPEKLRDNGPFHFFRKSPLIAGLFNCGSLNWTTDCKHEMPLPVRNTTSFTCLIKLRFMIVS